MSDSTSEKVRNPFARRSEPLHERFSLLVGESADSQAVLPLYFGLDPAFSLENEDGSWSGVDVSLSDPLPLSPSPQLFDRWRTTLLNEPVIDGNDAIAYAIKAVQGLAEERLHILDPSCADHPEALDFSDPEKVEENFFYLHDLLHRRRVRQIADVAAEKVREAIRTRGSATVLEIGPGPIAVHRATASLLSEEERKSAQFVAVDVSVDLLRYGLAKHWLDEAFVANIATFDVDDMQNALGSPDVIIACEILEHIESSAAVVNTGLIEWARRSNAWLIGSVPNAVQGVEIAGLFTGASASHQLTRHLFDKTTEHIAFYTYPTLRRALTEFWKAESSSIWGNGIRLNSHGSALCLDAALYYPHRSDRLCFAAKFNESGE